MATSKPSLTNCPKAFARHMSPFSGAFPYSLQGGKDPERDIKGGHVP